MLRFVAIGACLSTVALLAQTPAAFTVASVKTNRSGERLIRTDTEPGGRFIAVNATLRTLIQLAYGLEEFEIVGAPEWATSEHFDVNARADEELPPLEGPTRGSPALQARLQALLRDRFALTAHTESRDGDVFSLTAVRADHQLGPRLTRSAIDCAALFAAAGPNDGPPACGVRMSPGSIVLEGIPLSQLASSLTGLLGRPVVDNTGIAGTFDLQLAWDPPAPTGTARPDAISLFTALADQAGLRLVAARAPRRVLIVDSVSHPTEN